MCLQTKYTHLPSIDFDVRIQHDKARNLTWWQWTLQSMYVLEQNEVLQWTDQNWQQK